MIIGYLRGELIEHGGGKVIIDCNGVGYLAHVSSYTSASLPPLGSKVKLRVFTQVTENRIALYGFLSAAERELFDLLITVKKVGPSSAMGILSAGAPPLEIVQLIAGTQTAALTKLKGVGKKTAEMLVVELHEKCELLLATWAARGDIEHAPDLPRPVLASSRPPVLDDVASALVQLGWRQAEVDKVVAELPTDDGGEFEPLLKQALRMMPR